MICTLPRSGPCSENDATRSGSAALRSGEVSADIIACRGVRARRASAGALSICRRDRTSAPRRGTSTRIGCGLPSRSRASDSTPSR